MAELHGRVFRFQNCGRLAALLFTFAFCCTGPSQKALAQAEVITVRDIERWATQLRKPSAEVRSKAFKKLCALPASALPAIKSRIRRSHRQLVPIEDGREALRNFRHETGSRRADDNIDIQTGILAALKIRRTRTMGRTAERVCLVRSLEAIGTVEAYNYIADVFSLSSKMWNWEQKRVVQRVGLRMLPALINATGHSESTVRKWGSWGIAHLEMDELGVSVSHDDKALVAQVIRAYARTRVMKAMPLVVSFVGSHDLALRDAARWGVEQYGRNSVWQLRIAYRNAFEEDASPEWGWRRTAKKLFARLDAKRLKPVHDLLDQGLAAVDSGDLKQAEALFDKVLANSPLLERRAEMAEGYAAFATAAKQQGKADDHERLLQRAAWLAPDKAHAWNSELLFAESERLKARGIVDTELLRRTLKENPEHEEAADELQDLTGETVLAVVPELATEKPSRGFLYLMLLGLVAACFARRKDLLLTGEAFKIGFTDLGEPVQKVISERANLSVWLLEKRDSARVSTTELVGTIRAKLSKRKEQASIEEVDAIALRADVAVAAQPSTAETSTAETSTSFETSNMNIKPHPLETSSISDVNATWKEPDQGEWLLSAMEGEDETTEQRDFEAPSDDDVPMTLATLILQASAMQESSPGTIESPK